MIYILPELKNGKVSLQKYPAVKLPESKRDWDGGFQNINKHFPCSIFENGRSQSKTQNLYNLVNLLLYHSQLIDFFLTVEELKTKVKTP